MNVTELARRVNIPTEKLRDIIPQLGFDVGRRAIKVDDKIANAIIQKLNDPAVRAQFEEKEQQEEKDSSDRSRITLQEGVVQIPQEITVKDLAVQLKVPVAQLILTLMRNGIMAAQNEKIDYETAAIVAEDYGFAPQRISISEDEEGDGAGTLDVQLPVSPTQAVPRPPVVVVMGHVDHGKTKLLDAIRHTNIVDREHGGITQHIGAYQVEWNKNVVTFIDTPGHEAFSAMRSRGARVADIAVLVVAADDGVQPQTIEAITHIRRAELPFVVAINKVDKPEANPDRVKQELADVQVIPEEWGGDIPMVPVSALKGTGIDALLDLLLLVRDMHRDAITADPDIPAVGTIIESHVDKGEGPVATLLVQHGVLKKGDVVQVGDTYGSIKSMRNFRGEVLESASPSTPAKILGLKAVPKVGDIAAVVADIREAKQMLKKKRKRKSTIPEVARAKLVRQKKEATETVKVIIKADVLGSLEAVMEALEPVEFQSGEALQVVQKGLGAFTEADAMSAADQGALLVGFNVSVPAAVKEYVRDHSVSLQTFSVIYDLVDWIKERVEAVLPAETVREDVGTARIVKVFRKEGADVIAGGKVRSGKIVSGLSCDIMRKGKKIAEAQIVELHSGKEDVREVVEGQECGIHMKGYGGIEPQDEIVVFHKEERKQTIQL